MIWNNRVVLNFFWEVHYLDIDIILLYWFYLCFHFQGLWTVNQYYIILSLTHSFCFLQLLYVQRHVGGSPVIQVVDVYHVSETLAKQVSSSRHTGIGWNTQPSDQAVKGCNSRYSKFWNLRLSEWIFGHVSVWLYV